MLLADLALTVPFFLYPLALYAYSRKVFPASIACSVAMAGPLVHGAIGGLLILGQLALSANTLLTLAALPALLLLTYGMLHKPAILPGETIVFSWDLPFALLPFLLVAAQWLIYPAVYIDDLRAGIFAQNLAEHWNFYSLPFYQPDARGYFFPLSHSPPLLFSQAWTMHWAGAGGRQFLVAWNIVGFGIATTILGRRIMRYGHLLLVAILCTSAGLWIALLRNPQDSFRYISFGLFLLLIQATQHQSRWPQKLAAGFTATIGVLYSSLLLPISGLIMGTRVLYAKNGRERWQLTGVFLLSLGLASYPYLANLVVFGTPLVPQTLADSVLSFSSVFRADALGDLVAAGGTTLFGRLQLIFRPHNLGIAVALLPVIPALLLRKPATRSRLALTFSMALAAMLFLAIDPTDHIRIYTGKSFWDHGRYTQILLPWLTACYLLILSRSGSWQKPLGWATAALSLALIVHGQSYRSFAIDARLPQRNGPCLSCSNATKLAHAKPDRRYETLQWLATVPGARCIAFEEGKYFGWTQLYGYPKYSPTGQRIFKDFDNIPALTHALVAGGANCIFSRRGRPEKLIQGHQPLLQFPHLDSPLLEQRVGNTVLRVIATNPVSAAASATAASLYTSPEFVTHTQVPLPAASLGLVDLVSTDGSPLPIHNMYLHFGTERKYRLRVWQTLAPHIVRLLAPSDLAGSGTLYIRFASPASFQAFWHPVTLAAPYSNQGESNP